jgi:putative Ca2+/H+ antiporter (TMEM165/GDT1 family)
MDSTIIAFLFSVGAVLLAEMGDKSQLLAMAFATKYKASKVLLGICVATILNHALAVAVGNYITHFDSVQVWIQGIASLSFVFFGLWTIRGDKLEGEENKKTKFGAVITVAFAFFLAEMGDKTQLTTIALATKFPENPFGILIGSTSGMLIADAIGIVLGVVLCKKIPEKTVKFVSSGAFILFGFIGTYQFISYQLNFPIIFIAITMSVIVGITGLIAYFLIKKDGSNNNNDFTRYCQSKESNENINNNEL